MSFESNRSKRRMVSYTSAFALACSVAPGACLADPLSANALPSGGQVVGGVAAIVTGERVLDVNQASQRAVIVWDRFDVGSGATVNFNQPGASAVTLNQVNSATRSIIDGAVNANGQVVIVNGNGILFGKDAVVNVGGLVATTMSPDRQRFMNGDSVQSFVGGSSSGSIVNEGRLAGNNLDSYIALMAPSVQNSGVIVAMLSEANTVALAAGEKVTLTFAGNRLVDVAVDAAVVNALISNKHLIQVGGGQVLISATDAFKLLGSTIRNEGSIAANSIQNVGGKVRLTAGAVSQSGSISVGSATGRGGELAISAKDITLAAGSSIDASGGQAGGSVSLAASERIELAAGSTVSADAAPSGVGDGGSIVIIADLANTASSTRVGGALSARGGGGDGKGGFIETSGTRVDIADSAAVSTRSLGGNAGQYLIDPNDFEVSSAITANISGATLTTLLNSGNVTLQAGTGTDTATNLFGNITTTGTQGNINIYDAVSWSANTLTLNSGFNINVGSSTRTGSLTVSGSGALVLNPSSSAVAGFTAGGTVLMGMAASPTGGPNGNGYNGSINLSATDATRLLATSASPVLTIDGSKYNVVTTAADLNRINTDLGGKYALGTDLSIGGPLAPLGSGSNHTGVFDGLGHTVSATTVSCAADNCGFIASSSGQIRNLGLSYSAGITSAFSNVGGLLGTGNARIRNSYNTGNVSGVNWAGGLVGRLRGGTIIGSYATGVVRGVDQVGGLAGDGVGSTVTSSHATGNVEGTGNHVGGLVGFGFQMISATGSYATGAVSGLNQVGGLVGSGVDVTFTDSYATGVVRGVDQVGGLVGRGERATFTNSYATGNVVGTGNIVGGLVGNGDAARGITGSYATGNVVGTGHSVGGLVGFGPGAIVTGSHATGAVSGLNNVGGLVGNGFGIRAVTGSYATGDVSGLDVVGGLAGNAGGGTLTDSYATGNVVGTGTGTVGGLVGSGSTATFLRSYATGAVSGVNQVGGLAGNAAGGTLTDSYATGAVVGTGTFAGGLVGLGNSGATFLRSYATGAVSGVNQAGGLAGNGEGATFTDSYATGAVRGTVDAAGGLIGRAFAATILNSYATGSVRGGGQVGGLVGAGNNMAGVTNSYSTGAVEGTGGKVGGLVGNGFQSPISNSYATGSVRGVGEVGGLVGDANSSRITNSYSSGAVVGTGSVVGGFVGNGFATTFTDNYWNSTNNPSLSVTTGGVGNASTATSGVTALTTAQMRSASSFSSGFGSDGMVFTMASGWGYGAVNVNQGFPVRCSVSMCVSYEGGLAVTTLFLLPLTGQTSTYGSAPVIDYLFYESASGSGTSYLPATVGASGIASYTITKGGSPYRSGTLLSTDGAGTYSLTYSGGISLSDTGFVVASTGYTTPVSFTIAPKALTVTANNTSKTFDSAAYTGGAGVTYSGFVNGESGAALSGTLAYSGTSQGAVSVGSYVITPGGLSSGNYTIAFGDGTLTINAAPASGLMDPGTQFLSVGAAMGPGTGAGRGMGMGAPTTLAANSADDGGGDTGTSGGGGSGTASTAKRSDDGEDDSSATESSGTRTASAAKSADEGGSDTSASESAAAMASMAVRAGAGAGGSSIAVGASGGMSKPDYAQSSCVGKECVRGLRPTINKLKAGLVSLIGAQNPRP